MPAWLIAARGLLARGLAITRGTLTRARGAAAPLALGAGGAAAVSALADPAGGLFPDIFGGGEIPSRRRRRRRALTASDRADIAFIAGALGPAAGKAFAVQLVAGLTR